MFRQLIATLFAALALNAFAAVDVNQASQAELESVKGIGPGLSTKILDARKTSSFKDWNDLVDRVSGVGPGNANRFSQAGLTVAGKTFEPGAVSPTKTSTRTAKAPKSAPAERKSSRQPAPTTPQ